VGGSSLSCPPDAHPGTRRHLPSAASTRPITSKQKPLDIHTSFNMRYPRHMDRGCDSEDGKGDSRYDSLRLTSLGPTAPPPGPESGPVPPGHSILTASFATRGPRVQIPPAPQTPGQGVVGDLERRCLHDLLRPLPREYPTGCMPRAPRRVRDSSRCVLPRSSLRELDTAPPWN
jgi:hypothetical protein